VALLRGLAAPLPRLWEIEIEREENAREDEVDLVLEEEYEEEIELETSLFAELHGLFAPYESDEIDEEKAVSFALSPVPQALLGDFKAYKDYRLEPLNRMRDGSCVVDLTAASDVSTSTRFLGWLVATQPDLPALRVEAVFGHEKLGEWAESWVKMLREERELKYSSLANYTNGLFNVSNYVYAVLLPSEAALALDVQPPEQLLRMRTQAEKLAFEVAGGGEVGPDEPINIMRPQRQLGAVAEQHLALNGEVTHAQNVAGEQFDLTFA
jgi:hypothetical protein